MHHDYSGFKGDLKFIRDDQGQKAFSKLRSSIAGIYAWRIGQPPSGGVMPMQYVAVGTNRADVEKEADFAFKQAFAFCPYSPEAVYRYVQLLVNMHRVSDALLVAETAQKLDPYNGQFAYLIHSLRDMNGQGQIESDIAKLEAELKPGSTDFIKQFELAQKLIQVGKNEEAYQVLDAVLTNPHATLPMVMSVADAYNKLSQPLKLQAALERLTHLAPESPEAWYDLAASYATMKQNPDAIKALKTALELNAKRLKTDPKTPDIRPTLAADPRFASLRETPEFKALPTTL